MKFSELLNQLSRVYCEHAREHGADATGELEVCVENLCPGDSYTDAHFGLEGGPEIALAEYFISPRNYGKKTVLVVGKYSSPL